MLALIENLISTQISPEGAIERKQISVINKIEDLKEVNSDLKQNIKKKQVEILDMENYSSQRI